MNRRLAIVLLSTGIAMSVLFSGVALLQTLPVHRSPIAIQAPQKGGIPPDFDIVFLMGRQDGPTYVVTLSVAGSVRADGGYNVGILVQDTNEPGQTYVYDLKYGLGREMNFGTPTFRSQDSLTFYFPLRLLGHETYIVGLDGVAFAPDTTSYVVEMPRENLRIVRLLVLPLGLGPWIAAAVLMAAATSALTVRAFRRTRGSILT